MRRREVTITIVSDAGAVVAGYGSRDALVRLTGRPPCWSPLSRGWCVQTWRVPDLVAHLEAQGYVVAAVDERMHMPVIVVGGGGR